jgi:hypothetical protein
MPELEDSEEEAVNVSSWRNVCRVGTVLAMAMAASGCVNVRNGLHNMVEDAGDIVRFDVSTSFGTDMGAHVMATKFVQLKSYSYEDLYRVGHGGRILGLWREDRQDTWLGPKLWGNANVKAKGVAALVWGAPSKAMLGWPMESVDEFGVGFHAFVLGARVGVRPLELADFLVAPFGLDLCDDNRSWQMRQAMRAAKEAARKKQEEEKKEDSPAKTPQ